MCPEILRPRSLCTEDGDESDDDDDDVPDLVENFEAEGEKEGEEEVIWDGPFISICGDEGRRLRRAGPVP